MKVINRPRGSGKTTQLLYVSNFNDWPIICFNEEHKKSLQFKASELGISIPDPITISELVNHGTYGKVWEGYLIDEADAVLAGLVDRLTGGRGRVKGMELTAPMSGDRKCYEKV